MEYDAGGEGSELNIMKCDVSCGADITFKVFRTTGEIPHR